MLVYRLLENETRKVLKRYIFNLLNIKEHNISQLNALRRIEQVAQQSAVISSSITTTTTTSTITLSTNTNYIRVAPLIQEHEN
jgi:hypothetical protein